MERAVFLDRDGTVIVDKAYLDTVEGVELLPGAGEGLRSMVEQGFRLVLVTNQSGIGRGYFAEEIVLAQHERLQELLLPHGVRFDTMVYCPHSPDVACACRKPEPGMIVDAAAKLDVDCRQSWMIGDKAGDAKAGSAAGCRTIRIGPDADGAADFSAVDLREAAAIIAREG